ncbi:MAG: hypothetical protein ABW250_18410 [Pyrinomonadaceae bacterium]
MSRSIIHIGYPKAGSTFLQAWFGRHPELRFVPEGIGGFRNVYEMARPSPETFKYYVTSCEDLSAPHGGAGDIPLDVVTEWMTHPATMKQEQAGVCDALKALFPGSRVIIVTRGFKGIIRSGYSQYVKSGGVLGTLKTLPEDVRADAFRYASVFYDFDYLIKLYGEAFGRENLLVLPYELLRDDRDRFLAVLEEWLGLRHAEIKLGRLNPSLSPEELYWYPRISRVVSAAAARLGPARYKRFYGWYVGRMLGHRLRPLVQLLRLLRPDGKVTEADFPDDMLEHCRGKATLLKENPLYAPYAAEYLLDSASREASQNSNDAEGR